MSSANPKSPNSGGQTNPASDDAQIGSQNLQPGLLEQVMRQTLRRREADEPLEPAEIQVLREVASRYRGRPLTLEPVAVELVQAVLDSFCPTANNKSESWRIMSAEVAQSLMNDPQASERLKAFWIRLCEE